MSILETAKAVNKSSIDQFENKKPEFNIKLIDSWFIRYNQGGMVYPHNHGNFSWSCVYYAQIGKETKKMNGSIRVNLSLVISTVSTVKNISMRNSLAFI